MTEENLNHNLNPPNQSTPWIKTKTKKALDWGTSIVVLGIAIYLIFFLKGEANMCMEEPLKYGVQKFEEQNNLNISCICSGGNNYDRTSFSVTSNEGIVNLLKRQPTTSDQLTDYPNVTRISDWIKSYNQSES